MWNGSVVFLGTHDLEKTHSFYVGLLGLELYKDQGLCRIYAVPGGGMLGFCQHMTVCATEKGPFITLLTDDVDGYYEMLLANDVTPEKPPQVNAKFNIYHFFVKDPNGYTVEIQRFLD